jgi:hypothetical protein
MSVHKIGDYVVLTRECKYAYVRTEHTQHPSGIRRVVMIVRLSESSPKTNVLTYNRAGWIDPSGTTIELSPEMYDGRKSYWWEHGRNCEFAFFRP